MRRLFVIFLTLAFGGQAWANPVAGTWQNEAGSVVHIEAGEDGQLTGYYQTELGAPDDDSLFPLTGWHNGDAVAFSVRFEGFSSITSWSGQVSKDEEGPFIRTLWHYTKDIPDEKEADDLWRSINSGFAIFRPSVSTKEAPALP